MGVLSTSDPRIPPQDNELMSQRYLAAAKEDGIENEPTLVRLVKAFEKLEAGPLVDKSELVFIGYELEAAIEAFNQVHHPKRMSVFEQLV
jgi:hypothetical protein